MLQCVIVNCVAQQTLQGCSEQIALEGQDLPRTYLARHELVSVIIMMIVVILSTYSTHTALGHVQS